MQVNDDLGHDEQALIEATDQIAIVLGFAIGLDFQDIFHLGADAVADPVDGVNRKPPSRWRLQ
jgi:hypothetical protein